MLIHTIRQHPGNTDMERTLAYLLATEGSFQHLAWREQVGRAGEVLRAAELESARGTTPSGGRIRLDAQDLPPSGAGDSSEPPTPSAGSSEVLRIARELVDELAKPLAEEDIDAVTKVFHDLRETLARLTGDVEILDQKARLAAVRQYSGRNDLERAISYLLANSPAFAAAPWSAQVGAAAQFMRSGKVLF